METFCFKLYYSERNIKLHMQINAAGLTYNHCIALHNRYYKLFGKYLSQNKLKKHLTKLKKLPKFKKVRKYKSFILKSKREQVKASVLILA